MKNIPLSQDEIKNLRDLYSEQLDAAKRRIATLTNFLNKLGQVTDAELKEVEELTSIIPTKKTAKRGRPKKIKSTTATKQQNAKTSKSGQKPAAAAKTKAMASKETAQTKDKAKTTPATKAKKSTGKKKAPRTTKKRENKSTVWSNFVLNALEQEKVAMLSSDMVKIAMEKFNHTPAEESKVKSDVAGALTKLVNKDKKVASVKIGGQRAMLYALPSWLESTGELKAEHNKQAAAIDA